MAPVPLQLRTERLTLTAPDRQTWVEVLAGHLAPAVLGYPTMGDLVMARLVVDGHLAAGEWGPWQIIESSTGLLIGGAGFKGAPQPPDDTVEIGYGLAPEARGKGYATESVSALAQHAFARGVRQVVADTDVDNAASIAVLRRVGFTESGRDLAIIRWHLGGSFAATS